MPGIPLPKRRIIWIAGMTILLLSSGLPLLACAAASADFPVYASNASALIVVGEVSPGTPASGSSGVVTQGTSLSGQSAAATPTTASTENSLQSSQVGDSAPQQSTGGSAGAAPSSSTPEAPVIVDTSSPDILGQGYFRTYGDGGVGPLNPSNLSSISAAIPGLWLDFPDKRRRTRSQIYIEILELLKRGPMTPFELAFYARLNHKRSKGCAEFMRLCGYLEVVEEDGKMSYVLTKEGLSFLERAKALFVDTRRTSELNGMEFRRFS